MLKWLIFQFVLSAVWCVYTTICSLEVKGVEGFSKESEYQQQQVSSWSPFSQWRWLNNFLPYREGQIDEDYTTSQRETNPPSSTNAEDDSILSLALILDATDEDRIRNEVSKVSISTPTPAVSFEKRSKMCMKQGKVRCRRGQISMIPAAQARQAWKDDYFSISDILIQFSQKQAEEQTVCDDLSVQLFRVDLKEHYVEPMWIRESVHLGMCPSMLQKRHLGEHVLPSSIVETKCLCHHKTCSNLGGDFNCEAIRLPIRTWIRSMEKFMPSQEMVTVGCVCVQRTSPEGKYAKPAIES